jgi:tetratricopeptide (TPR) repeat protein
VSNRLNLAVAVAAFGLFGATAAFAAKDKADKAEKTEVNPACGSNKISKPMEKAMNAAQKAREQHNWEEMVVQALAADAAQPEKTEFDKFWVHELEGVAYANLKKYPDAVRELDASLNSPCMTEADKPQRTKLLMQLSYQAKDYDKAIAYGNKLYQPGGDPDVGIYLANAYYVKDDYANARKVMTDVVSTMEASGKTPDEQTYRILQSSCLALKDENCVVELIEKLVAHYPKPQYWENLVDALLRSSKSDRELLNILRLSDGVQVMKDPGEFIEMAQLATAQGLPGEAQAIIEKGLQKGAFADAKEKEHANRVLADAKTAVALDKSTLDKQDASARAKPTGEADVKLGSAYLSYGQTDKAIEAFKRGIGKGGVKYPDEASLLLGIAYLRANNKDEAVKTFQSINKDPMMTRLAKLWTMSAQGA